MKKFIILISFFLLGIFAYKVLSHFSLLGFTKESQVIEISQKGFPPTSITVKKGARIVFKNNGEKPQWPASDFHPTHGIYPEFDPQKEIPPGEQWSFQFKKIGKWRAHDHLEPLNRGVIIVEE